MDSTIPILLLTPYQTVHAGGVLVTSQDTASLYLVRLFGPDARSFLQNRTSNDVLALTPGLGQLTCSLDAKAHVQSVFTLHQDAEQPDTYWAVWQGEPSPERFLEKLFRFRVIEQVQGEVQAPETSLLLMGPAAGLLLEAALKASGTAETEALLPLLAKPYTVFNTSLCGQSVRLLSTRAYGQRAWLILAHNAETLLPDLTALAETGLLAERPLVIAIAADTPLLESLNTLRIEAGWPQVGIDISESTLLPETGLELEAVSYTKGCYPGQETVARVRTYGAVQRALVGLTLTDWPNDLPLPPSDCPCLLEGKSIGTLTSICRSKHLQSVLGLAYLDKAHRVPGQKLLLLLENKPTEAIVTTLPFYTPEQEAKRLLDQGLKTFAEASEQTDPEEAIGLLKQAILLNPALADAYEALGVMLSRQERYEEAISQMERLQQLDPERVMAHTNLSIYYMKLGDKERAEEEKAKATTLGMRLAMRQAANKQTNPVDETALREKREAATREKIALFQEALAFSPDDPLGNFGLATAHQELGEFEAAITAYHKTIAAQPKHSVAYLNLGKCYQALGHKPQAVETFEKGITIASEKGDRMPLQEMQQRLQTLLLPI